MAAYRERINYVRPKESSTQHEYAAKDAVRQQEEDRVQQNKARKAGELATETVAEIDEILDEIDSVLEENAREFVEAFQQKGGE